jgi:L,D-transpeptidase ErfK/SrfK
MDGEEFVKQDRTRSACSRRLFAAGLATAVAAALAGPRLADAIEVVTLPPPGEAPPAAPAAEADPVPPSPLVGDIYGTMGSYVTWDNDNLLDLARSEELGLIELMAANPGIDPWLPGRSVSLVLPTAHIVPAAPRRGMVINTAELRIYFFHPSKGPFSFPIGVGREGFSTPQGDTRVVRKKANPTWIPTAATRRDRPELPAIVPPGPDNPMGEFALYLGWPTYAVHGTNQEWAVGRRVTRGCIRLHAEDIAWLFDHVPSGTLVTVVNQAFKLGRRDGQVYVEVHPSLAQIDEMEETGKMTPSPYPFSRDQVVSFADGDASRIDWAVVEKAAAERRGYPIRITG